MFVGVVVSFVAAAGGEGESTTRNCRLAWGLGREVGTRGEQSVNAQETIGSGGFGRFDETSGSRLEDARVRVRVCSLRARCIASLQVCKSPQDTVFLPILQMGSRARLRLTAT